MTSKIYLTKNMINGKIYIGQKQSDSPAWYIGGGVKLRHAIKKYGRENFSHSILLECDSSQADAFEQFFIWWYGSQDNSVGYNVQDGGSACSSEIARARMAISRKGVTFTASHRESLSRARMGLSRSAESVAKWRISRDGFRQSDEARAKISASQIGGKKAKSVCRLNEFGEVLAVYRGGFALRADGFDQSKVSECALGKRRSHKGFFWRYEVENV